MASTSGMDIAEIDPTQLGKAATANTAFGAIDLALGGSLAIQADAAGYGSPYTIPYQTGDEPAKTKTALRFFVLTINGALTHDWTAYMPSGKMKPFVIQNNTSGGFNVVIKVSGQTGVTVPAGQTWFCYLNGTDVVQLPINLAANTQPWDIGNFIDGSPTAGQIITRWISTRTVTYPPNFANNQMKSSVAATGLSVFNINKNGVLVGQGTILGGATSATWTSVGGVSIVFNAGDVGTFVAPNPADATLADLAWAFAGTR